MIRNLLLLRHGEADHPGPPAWNHDSQRPLTAEGREKIRHEARGMKVLGLPIDMIVASPYRRTRETAEAVAQEYRLADRSGESDLLEPGATVSDLRKTLRTTRAESVLVVGHNPDLGEMIGELLGTEPIVLGKGWLAWIRLPEGNEIGGGRLKALLPADLLVQAGRLAND